ncbi:MAG: spore protease YyaC [Bacillota bacterium]
MALLKNPAVEINGGEKTRVHMDDPLAVSKIAQDLVGRLHKLGISQNSQVVILCIGTDRSTGDALGPLVGDRLAGQAPAGVAVYGTLENPVHATNLAQVLEEVRQTYHRPLVIAVDACLGRLENVGCVSIGDGPLNPGAGVNKNLPPVGDLHITGIVNIGGFMEYVVLQNTRLHVVVRMAGLIAAAIMHALSQLLEWEQYGAVVPAGSSLALSQAASGLAHS